MNKEKMDIVYEMKTDKNIEEAIESLEEELKKHHFGVLWQLNFKDKLAEKGLKLAEDFVVLEVCNPKEAKKALEINSSVGYVLPCKMVVRKEDGQSYIGMTNPEVLISLFDQAELDQLAEEVGESLKKAIQASI